jgi:hypothetical protein
MGRDPDTPEKTWAPDGPIPVARVLADNDMVVNCVLQDPDAPLIFVTEEDLAAFTTGSLIVDVSCDVGMGFSWAHPTSFTHPVIELANGVHYYAVDHSPSYLWNSATWEISEALLPHIETLLAGLRRGMRPRRSHGQSRSATASFSTPASCRFSTATMPIRTLSAVTAPSSSA